MSLPEAQYFKPLLARVQKVVLPDRQIAADEEAERNKQILTAAPNAKVNKHHANFLKRWWQLSYSRSDMVKILSGLNRYIACVRVTKRPIFDFISTKISPNDSLQVFAFEDDYSFGILQSNVHWTWFTERCSTMKADPRYTSNTVFDTFPWPQKPTAKAIDDVASAARELRKCRDDVRAMRKQSLREMYRTLELPGVNPLKDAHSALDQAVRNAYGMSKNADPLAFLLALNQQLVEAERKGEAIQGPGLPASVKNRASFISTDCVTP